MKTHSTNVMGKTYGFALREMLTVLSIIVVLATIAIPTVNYFKEATKENNTLVLVKVVSHGLEEYRLEFGYYPDADGKEGSSNEFYTALYGDEDGDGYTDADATNYLPSLNPHIDKSETPTRLHNDHYIVTDSWQNEICYRSPGVINPNSGFDLWSLGGDARGGPESGILKERADDINNW